MKETSNDPTPVRRRTTPEEKDLISFDPSSGVFKVLAPGTDVYIGNSELIKAKIIQVVIGYNKNINYLVSWWDGTTRRTETLPPHEITIKDHH